jgi:glucose/arabinose dehydrogenase
MLSHRMKFGLCCLLLLCNSAMVARGAALVQGFSESAFPVPGLSLTTDIEFAPDTSRRLFIAQKNGVVRVMLQNGTLLTEPFASINVFQDSECGLVGMCFDPNFLVNRYVYLFATVSSSEQQIIRCQDVDGTASSIIVLVPRLPTLGANHDGGGLAVGLDGKLHFSIGDLGATVGVNADLSSMASKLGRCNLDGTAVMFNPFLDGPGGNNDFIWARGFRNPFKLAVQPSTGLIWVDVAGGAYEQIFAVDKGDHAGWVDYENDQPAGYIPPRIKYRTNGTDTRQIADGGVYWHSNVITFTMTSAHGFRRGERVNVTGVLNSSVNGTYYVSSVPGATTFTVPKAGPHIVSTGGAVTTLAMGGAVTGGCFYNSTAFADSYRQNYFFCDYNSGRINRATFDVSNEVASVDYFVNAVNGAVDVTTGVNGHLYYAGVGNETIYRLAHTVNPQRIVVTPQFLNMAEGGIAVVHVRLTSGPASDVTMTVARTSGSAALSTTNLSLIFTPANFADTQPVFIDSAADADRAPSQAVFTLSCPGYPVRTFNVNAYDPGHGTLTFASVARTNNLTRFQIATERKTRLALEASSNLVSWQPFTTNLSVTNIATLFDNSPVSSQRFYRARIVR